MHLAPFFFATQCLRKVQYPRDTPGRDEWASRLRICQGTTSVAHHFPHQWSQLVTKHEVSTSSGSTVLRLFPQFASYQAWVSGPALLCCPAFGGCLLLVGLHSNNTEEKESRGSSLRLPACNLKYLWGRGCVDQCKVLLHNLFK